jgi:hypothetical protein
MILMMLIAFSSASSTVQSNKTLSVTLAHGTLVLDSFMSEPHTDYDLYITALSGAGSGSDLAQFDLLVVDAWPPVPPPLSCARYTAANLLAQTLSVSSIETMISKAGGAKIRFPGGATNNPTTYFIALANCNHNSTVAVSLQLWTAFWISR